MAGGGEMVSGMVNMKAQWKDKEGIEREKMFKFNKRKRKNNVNKSK